MTSALLRRLAAIVVVAVGIVFASNSANANAASVKHQVTTPKVHSVQVAHTPAARNTSTDWWI